MARKFAIGNALLADYVGLGNRNKHNLVNVFSGDVLVKAFPSEIGFGLYVELLRPHPEALPDEFNLELTFDGNPILKAHGRADANAHLTSTVFIIPLFQFEVPNAGQLELVLSAPGFQKATAITKRVYLDTRPNP